ncbi:1411_t:CDS:1 [Funneliformis caledonium]|uniref:1411_t:CDS:1 n=1 Tax=Funneliformis caledonium TaxID=1117310 RepID=A0A9N8ZCE1_9GLOM|nr:1411_t:CDS:1 [Funneliformis caledonium]
MSFLTTPTGFSALPSDCLREIFQYFVNDMTSLYCCMLVNRTWCRIIIPLLWRRPFEYSESKSKKYFELIRTYLDCLTNSARMRIRKVGYYLPSYPRPLFPYHEYLKELDCEKLDEAVEEWIGRFEFDQCLEDPDDIIYTELLKLLMSQRQSLWRLRLGQYKKGYNLPPISTFPRIKYTLANLRRFEFRGDIDCLSEPGLDNLYDFLIKLSHISNGIEKIYIDMTEDDYGLSVEGLQQLIASQKNLLSFHYNQEMSEINNSKSFIEALSSNANTLKNVEFNNIPLNEQCLGALKKFHNLESMQFVYCYEKDIFNETVKVLEDLPSQLKVEKLMFHRGDLSSVTLEVLRLANTNVRELTVDNIVPDLFEVILEHCPNIVYLAAAISQKTFESLACLSTSKIEHLILKTLDTKNIETKDFQQLGKSLSLSLHHLSLNFNISVEELSSLLKECQSPLKSLCLKFDVITDDDINRDEYLRVVMEFAKKNELLKEFKFYLDVKSDLFDVLKAKDIFTKDIFAEAQLIIPKISQETLKPFTYSEGW